VAVQRQVVAARAHRPGLAAQLVEVVGVRGGKRVVHGGVAVLLVAPLQQRKLRYPQKFIRALAQAHLLGHVQAQPARLLEDVRRVPGQHQHQVALARAGFFDRGPDVFQGQGVLAHRRPNPVH